MIRTCYTPDYHWEFNTETGFFRRWGTNEKDDPQVSPFGMEILDVCVSKRCGGVGKPCTHCYQNSGPYGANMSFVSYKTLLRKLPLENLTQVALGIGDLYGNPDLFKIMHWTREQGPIPNVTIHGFDLDDAGARELASVAGAVAVSRYSPKDVCYDAVERLANAGLKQVNVHMLTAVSTLRDCFELIDDAKNDARLAKLNAIVFLAAKQKGRGTWLESVPQEKYSELISYAIERGVSIGFDSCSAHRFLEAVKDSPEFRLHEMVAEPCESSLFSGYIDVTGLYYPCSFSPGQVEGIAILEINDFMKEVWMSPQVESWRNRLLGNHRNCPLFTI